TFTYTPPMPHTSFLCLFFVFLMLPPPPRSTLFPYTTLFRSRVADSQRFIMGPEIDAVERELGALIGVRHAIAVSSGTDAVLLARSEEHTSELQSHLNLVCRLLLEKKKKYTTNQVYLACCDRP